MQYTNRYLFCAILKHSNIVIKELAENENYPQKPIVIYFMLKSCYSILYILKQVFIRVKVGNSANRAPPRIAENIAEYR